MIMSYPYLYLIFVWASFEYAPRPTSRNEIRLRQVSPLRVRTPRRMPASFVYQKKTKIRQGADICEQKCKRLACEIQVCLSRLTVSKSRLASSTIDQSRCQPDIDKYNRCCEAAKKSFAEQEARANGASSSR